MSMIQANKGPPVKLGEQVIEWLPLAAPTILPFSGTSYNAVRLALEKAFGPLPIRLTGADHELLRGMTAVAGEGHEPYSILMNAVEKFGEIEVR